MSKELTDAIVGMREDEAMRLVAAMLDAGADPADVLEEAKAAMTVLGDKFECEEVFIPELIMGGEIMKGIADELKPRIKGEAAAEDRGTVVLGTVAGDIHDIGKDVVVLMLDVNGYDVHDLGIDVPIEEFVAAINELKPQVVGLSGLLTLRVRLDEGDDRRHRRRREARPGQDHDRRARRSTSRSAPTPAPTAGAATRPPRCAWPPSGPGVRHDPDARGALRPARAALQRRGRAQEDRPRARHAALRRTTSRR